MSVALQRYMPGRTAVKIAEGIEAAIRDDAVRPGELLPTVRELASELGVSPTTVSSAYRRLRHRGLVIAKGRQGTRVSLRPPLAPLAHVPLPRGARDLATGNPDPDLLPDLRDALQSLETRPRLYAGSAEWPALVH